MRVELNIRASQLQEVLEVIGETRGDVNLVVNIAEDNRQRQIPRKDTSDLNDALEPESGEKEYEGV